MNGVLRAPALHFLLGGAVLLAVSGWWDARRGAGLPGGGGPIVVTADDVAQLRTGWVREHGVPPGPDAERALVEAAVEEETLYREALARGIDRADGAVRERLVRLGGFVGEDGARDAAALEQEARRLGLAQRDVVVRRHLVQMMRLATGRLGPSDLPTEAELDTYLARHAEEFTAPAQVRLTHVYLSADRHGPALARDAATLLAALRREGADPLLAPARGDAFIHGASVGPVSGADLERVFGGAFARALEDAPPGRWVGPVPSGYGLHLVWVHERVPARLPTLATVRSRVLHGWLAERSADRARERLEVMKARYQVRVDAPVR